MSATTRLFVFGLGYSAERFARAMRTEAGWIGGTVRTAEKAAAIGRSGLHVYPFDGSHPGIGVAAAIRHATHVLIAIAPGEADPVLAHHRYALAAAPHLAWIGYLSTVGVYGDHDGAWVDETTAPNPTSERSRRRLAAEEAWQALAAEHRVPLAIFRIAGIYGPERNALNKLAEGKARRIVKPGQVFNRIHVDDIVAALTAATNGQSSGNFNLADDEPAPPQDVIAHAADLMAVAPPPEEPFDEADLTPMARSFYGENKRVANGRLKSDLGISLAYPTYREGLAQLWESGTWKRNEG